MTSSSTANMADVPQWSCPTCSVPRTTPYCSRCGEQPPSPRDLTLRGLAEKVIHAFTDIDSHTLRTAWTLIRFPGELTLSWTRGVRRLYVAPFQLFLIANVVFFALQWLTAEDIFGSSLDSHINHQDWRQFARSLLTRRLEATHATLEQYAPVFDSAVVVHAKSLIMLMAVPFTLLLPMTFFRTHRPFMTHAVFSLHLYTFLLLVFCISLLVANVSAWSGVGGLEAASVDKALSVFNLGVCAAYLYLAIGRVYGATGVVRGAQAILLASAVAAIVLGYRFVLFLITLYST